MLFDMYVQIGSLEDHYHFHHSRVVRKAAYSLKGPHSFIHMDPMVRLRSLSFKWCQNVEHDHTNTFFFLLSKALQADLPGHSLEDHTGSTSHSSVDVYFSISSVHQWCENAVQLKLKRLLSTSSTLITI